MASAEIILTSVRPVAPEADFAFEIDFQRGEGSASRVFAATYDFIKACERIDRELASAIDSNIETVLMLEDIEAGSIKTWLKNALKAADDDALKKLDWKPLVGQYLVRAKYAILRWTDSPAGPRRLPDLAKEIQLIAQQTDVRHLPDYRAPAPDALVQAIRDFQGVKEHLLPADRAIYIPKVGPSLEMNLTLRLDVAEIEDLAVKETLTFPPAPMIMAVKKPDYLGDSKWELRHGKRSISAKIEDEDWLRRFQGRRVDVRPGDALKALVRIEHLYGHDNELLSERFTLTKVDEVLVNAYSQTGLFEDLD